MTNLLSSQSGAPSSQSGASSSQSGASSSQSGASSSQSGAPSSQSDALQQAQQQQAAVKVRLLKGPLFRAKHRDLWDCMERDQALIRSYFDEIGLSLRLDDAEGYAFLQQRDSDIDTDGDELGIPRLISRRQLSFAQTLLLVFLRKRLAEHDSEESAPRLVVLRSDMRQWLQPYFPEVGNQIKQHKDFDAIIKRIAEMGFISALPNHKDEFEVQRILKAFVSAEQIASYMQLFTRHLDEESEEETDAGTLSLTEEHQDAN